MSDTINMTIEELLKNKNKLEAELVRQQEEIVLKKEALEMINRKLLNCQASLKNEKLYNDISPVCVREVSALCLSSESTLNKHTPSKELSLDSIVEPNWNEDMLIGKGNKRKKNHKGNEYYTKLKVVALPYYNTFPPGQKYKVSEAIYEQFTGDTHHGKFVQKQERNNEYQELGKDKMTTKIGQALIDLTNSIKSKPSNLIASLNDQLKVRTS